MTSKTPQTPADPTTEATVTEITEAKGARKPRMTGKYDAATWTAPADDATSEQTPARKPRNRTARRQQLDDHAALAAAEANAAAGEAALLDAITPDEPKGEGESLTDDERAQLKEHTDQLAAERAAAEQATPVDQPQGDQTADEQTAEQPAKPKRARAERVARVEIESDVVPAGYLALKSTPSYQQFRKADPNAEGDEWLTRCAKHGTVKGAKNRKAGRALGSTSERVVWCSGCKADAKKAATAAAKAKADKASAPATSDATTTSDVEQPADATTTSDVEQPADATE